MSKSLKPFPDFSSSFKNWPIRPAKFFLQQKNVPVRNLWSETQLLSLTRSGVIDRDIESGVGKYPASFEGYQIVEPGDLVFCLFDVEETPRTVGLVKSRGMITSAYTCYKVDREIADPRFLEYLFVGLDNEKRYRPFYSGLRNTIPKNALSGSRFSLPPLEEQKVIADFLDRELLTIEANTSKQSALIELLVERKRALIAQVINNGLNSSQDAWLAKRLRHIATVESGSDYKEVEVAEGGYAVYGSGGEFTRASKYMHSGESVLLGRKGTVDRPLYVNEAFWTVDTMFWTRFRPGVHVKFIYYWATTLPFNFFKTSTAVPSMTGTDLKNMPIHLPPLNEQKDIAAYLDEKTAAIDTLIAKAQEFLETTRERQQALISAAVTGKINVQGKN